jgi:hypothetical protein
MTETLAEINLELGNDLLSNGILRVELLDSDGEVEQEHNPKGKNAGGQFDPWVIAHGSMVIRPEQTGLQKTQNKDEMLLKLRRISSG